ncbi:sarcosine oxidase, putative [Talaromyces stipitatus ATCC 10500]|uniref:Sarcosine oxidase, putative n=1 Tax=Talaromyces stipitatus (strain ATCC 10500 / CBS 375.48 / QM 6759 / NRRL 1006) TaxID=441959 RepID=B8MPB6_TALSN|nr:sarcosine oxidase, putative [Talaromyces stipitatus ATCC 10500]EED14355.1 sarcosine oxidase, putative [Talaromyces stipitatus ATCC 10500]
MIPRRITVPNALITTGSVSSSLSTLTRILGPVVAGVRGGTKVVAITSGSNGADGWDSDVVAPEDCEFVLGRLRCLRWRDRSIRRRAQLRQYRLVPPSGIRRLHNGLFSRADLDNIDEILLNASSGWVEANKTLQKVIDAAVCTGVVKRIEAEITRLIFDDDGNVCTGARTVDGRIISADSIILATGAETAKLLVKSVPEIPELHVGSRLSAAGLITGILRLSQNETSQLRSAPAFLIAGGKSQGAIIPPNTENELKITCDISFTNTVEIFSKAYVSMPPEDYMSTYSILSAEMNRALATVRESILGDGTRNHHFEDCRICWDAITPDQDFIISAHPYCRNFFIATGGSFHAWKFLPILGKYVVQMLEDRLDPDLAQRWFWNRDFSAAAANERMMPVRELRDLASNQVFSS